MEIRTLLVGDMQVNCYLLWAQKDRTLVHDPGDEAEAILHALRNNGLTVQAVVLTHGHADHMMAAQAVCTATGAPLWIGANDAPALADDRRSLCSWLYPGKTLALHADRRLREGDRLDLGSESLTVLETPGHTPGGICLLGNGVLFCGDTLFCGSMGRTDFPGGDARALRDSLRRLAALPESTAVYPGHGPATTIARERRCNPYLSENRQEDN